MTTAHDRPRRPDAVLLTTAALLATAAAVACAVMGLEDPLTLTQAAAELGAAGVGLVAARRTAGRVRAVWALVAASAAVWGVVDVVAAVAGADVARAGVLDAGWLAAYLPLLAALLMTYLALRPERDLQGLLDAAALVTVLAALSWGLVLAPVLASGRAADAGVALAYPALDLMLTGVLAWVALGTRRMPPGALWVLAGLGLRTVAGVALLAHIAGLGAEWSAAAGVLYAAAAAAWALGAARAAAAGPAPIPVPVRRRVPPWLAAAPIVVLGAAGLALQTTGAWAGGIALAMALLAVGLRVWAGWRDGERVEGALARGRDEVAAALEHSRAVAEELREGEARFRELADASPALMWLGDADGRRTFLNRTWLEFAGRRLDEELGDGWLRGVHPDDRELRAAAQRAAAAGGGPFEVTYRLRRSDGEYRWIQDSARPRTGPGGGVTGLAGSAVDVTEQRRAREEVQLGRERLALALEANGDALWDWDVTTGEVRFSDRWFTMLGHEPGALPGHVSTWQQLVHPDDAEHVAAVLEAHLSGRAPLYECEHRLRSADGRWIWVLDRGRVVARDAGGRALRAVGTQTDLTARREAEEAVRHERDRTQAVLAAMADGLVVVSPDGRVVEANPSMCRMLGLTAAEVTASRMPFPWWPDDEVPRLTRGMADLLAGAEGRRRATLRRGDGERFPAELTFSHLVDPAGRRTASLVTVRDVTAREARERMLTASEAAFRQLAEASSDMVLRVGADHRLRYASPASERQLGIAPDRLLAMTTAERLALVHPDDLPNLRAAHAALLRADGPDDLTLALRHRGAGGWVWLEMAMRRVEAVDGGGLEVLATVRDITERRRAQAEQSALRRVATLVAAAKDPEEVLTLVAHEAADLLEGDGGAVVRLAGEEADLLGVHVAPRLGGARADAVAPVLGVDRGARSAVARVWRDGRPARCTDSPPGRGLAAGGAPDRHSVAVPVHLHGTLWGALTVVRIGEGSRPFERPDEEQLGHFADLVGLALESAAVQRELIAQATTDPLTRLANHRVLHERLREEVSRSRRHGTGLALVLIDLDHFKLVNDRYGHQAGDLVLREVASRVRACAREHDVVARAGGEELAWLLPEATPEDAHAAAERLLAAIRTRGFGEVGPVTASVGVASLDQGVDAVELYRRADAALYWAKARGRDQAAGYRSPMEDGGGPAREGRPGRLAPAGERALQALVAAVDARGVGRAGHSDRVRGTAEKLATALGWAPDQVALLGRAALAHDIGMLGVPDRVLLHEGPLSPERRRAVEHHASVGADIVASMISAEAAAWVRHHHERWDGTGYPDGLAGERIPEGARIIGLAAAWSAMSSRTPWRPALAPEEALEECRRCSGGQFWPEAVAALEALVAAEPGAVVADG